MHYVPQRQLYLSQLFPRPDRKTQKWRKEQNLSTAEEKSESRNKPRSIDQRHELHKTAKTTVKRSSGSRLVQSLMHELLRAQRQGGGGGGRRRHGRTETSDRSSAGAEERETNTLQYQWDSSWGLGGLVKTVGQEQDRRS